MSFLVIPAVDLKDGKCVRLVRGDPRHKTVEIDNPVEVAKRWERLGAKRLHLIDLDGALEGIRKNESIVKKIVESLDIPVQFGGGIRSFEDGSSLLDWGAEKIILGTKAMDDISALERLCEKYGGDRLIVALDSKRGRVVTEGWVKETGERAADAAKRFESIASECLFTNVDVEGMVKGIDIEVIEEVVEATTMDVIASGGVSTLDDVDSVKKTGATGVVIGTALYKDKIDFRKALSIEGG